LERQESGLHFAEFDNWGITQSPHTVIQGATNGGIRRMVGRSLAGLIHNGQWPLQPYDSARKFAYSAASRA
jgi:hypothetical protein